MIGCPKSSNAYRIETWYKRLEDMDKMATVYENGQNMLNKWPGHVREIVRACETYSWNVWGKKWLDKTE